MLISNFVPQKIKKGGEMAEIADNFTRPHVLLSERAELWKITKGCLDEVNKEDKLEAC